MFFSDRRNRLYGKSASLRRGGKLFHSPGPAAAKGAVGPGNDACLALCGANSRQDESHQLSMTQNFRTATNEQL